MKKSLAWLTLILLPAVTEARLYNYEDQPIGERCFAMGHTCIAVPGDVGNMYYNPSVLAFNEHPQVSGSVSSYARIDTRTGENVSLFSSAQDNISRGGFVAVPSMVGGNLKTGTVIWGGAVLVPTSYKNSGTVKDDNAKLSSFEGTSEATWLGAFVAQKMNKQISLGLAVFYVSRSSKEKFLLVRNPSPVQLQFIEANYDSNGIIAILGGTYNFNEDLRVGYSVRFPAWHWGGVGFYGDATSGENSQKQDDFKTTGLPIPARLSVGVSWQKTPRWLLAADVHYYFPMRENLSSSKNEAFSVSAHEVINFSLGAEFMPWETLGFRSGLFSNFSSAGTLSKTLSAVNDKVNMFGATAAVVFQKPTGSISLGGYIQGGQGLSTPIDPDQTGNLVPRSNYLYGFVIASSYKF